jgi:hypothetical protein
MCVRFIDVKERACFERRFLLIRIYEKYGGWRWDVDMFFLTEVNTSASTGLRKFLDQLGAFEDVMNAII